MKNIHLLLTDKPSRLFKFANELHLDTVPKDYYKKYNIYITSDEEIKEGDWCIDKHKAVYKQETDKIFTEFTNPKKIILTTDQDLIADSVQAIDDEFLEWFVNNPSCEFVEVQDWVNFYKIFIPQEEVFEMYSHLYGKTVTMDDRFETKHIWCEALALKNKGRWIPQEESKQEQKELRKKLFNVIDMIEQEESKQETLEEAAENLYNEFPLRSESLNELAKEKFIAGAKWQAERMYSEEEVVELLTEREQYTSKAPSTDWFSISHWFKQFKKK